MAIKGTLTRITDIYAEPAAFSGKTVRLGGWVKTIRSSNAFGFLELNDGTCFKNLQIVFESDKINNYKEVAKLNVSASVIASGVLELTPGAKQPFELKAAEIEICGASTPDYPIQPKKHSFEFLRTVAHLRPRANTFNAVFRVTTLDINDPPRTEEGKVDYSQDFFGKSTNLTVSGQLEAECFALAYSNVYTFGPTFRAENSNTPRHAAEFWMIEPEIAFADLEDDMALAEEMTKYVIKYVLDRCPYEMEFFNRFIDNGLLERLNGLVNSDFARVSYTEAVKMLKDSGVKFEYPVDWGCDLQTEHERYLTEKIFGKPVFVTDYPKDIKAFYMRLNDDGKTVAAADMLVPGVGELIGGSQREERLDLLEARMDELGMNKADYSWYLDLRRYGGIHHAGYGLGFERLIMYITGIGNIRDVELFPRTVGSAEF